jgi:hypothetical protein
MRRLVASGMRRFVASGMRRFVARGMRRCVVLGINSSAVKKHEQRKKHCNRRAGYFPFKN